MNRERVEKELMRMGFRIGVAGFRCLIDALDLIYSEDKSPYVPHMMELYKAVGRRNGCSQSNAERNIRYAIKTYYDRNPEYPVELTPDFRKGTLSNREFLMRLRSMMKERFG